MTEIFIRKATKQDHETIVNCQIKMAFETEGLILDKKIVLNGVNQMLNESPLGYYLIAEDSLKNILGVMMVLYEWSDWRNGKILWIHSLYVKPEYRTLGVFKTFYLYLKNLVTNSIEYKGMRLFVEKNNTTAQYAYKAVGMSNEHYDLFEWMK